MEKVVMLIKQFHDKWEIVFILQSIFPSHLLRLKIVNWWIYKDPKGLSVTQEARAPMFTVCVMNNENAYISSTLYVGTMKSTLKAYSNCK